MVKDEEEIRERRQKRVQEEIETRKKNFNEVAKARAERRGELKEERMEYFFDDPELAMKEFFRHIFVIRVWFGWCRPLVCLAVTLTNVNLRDIGTSNAAETDPSWSNISSTTSFARTSSQSTIESSVEQSMSSNSPKRNCRSRFKLVKHSQMSLVLDANTSSET